MFRQRIDPAKVQPTGLRVLVKPYTRPEMFGNLHLPDSYQQDTSQTLWELVSVSPEAAKLPRIAEILKAGALTTHHCILITRRRWPVDSGLCDLSDAPLLFFSAGDDTIVSYQLWEASDE